jgi:hypothetical protein
LNLNTAKWRLAALSWRVLTIGYDHEHWITGSLTVCFVG